MHQNSLRSHLFETLKTRPKWKFFVSEKNLKAERKLEKFSTEKKPSKWPEDSKTFFRNHNGFCVPDWLSMTLEVAKLEIVLVL